MTTRYLSDSEHTADDSGKRLHFIDVAGVAAVMPAAIGALCAITRANLSAVSLAAITVLFLVCIISSLAGILISFWMQRTAWAWGVRLAGIAWMGVCAFIAISFVLQLAGFSAR